MTDTCPTVRVKTDNSDGYKVINESDFDSSIHELFEAKVEPPAPPSESPATETKAQKKAREKAEAEAAKAATESTPEQGSAPAPWNT